MGQACMTPYFALIRALAVPLSKRMPVLLAVAFGQVQCLLYTSISVPPLVCADKVSIFGSRDGAAQPHARALQAWG